MKHKKPWPPKLVASRLHVDSPQFQSANAMVDVSSFHLRLFMAMTCFVLSQSNKTLYSSGLFAQKVGLASHLGVLGSEFDYAFPLTFHYNVSYTCFISGAVCYFSLQNCSLVLFAISQHVEILWPRKRISEPGRRRRWPSNVKTCEASFSCYDHFVHVNV